MYYRISGAPFTVKSAEEKQEFIDVINADPAFSKHLICRGINVEQFTGKVTGVAVGEKDHPNRIYIFKCDGNFPTLKLYQKSSPVVYAIVFPMKERKIIHDPTVIPEPKPAAENKIEEAVKKTAEVIQKMEVKEPEPVVEQEEPQKVEPVEEPVVEEVTEPTQEDVFSADPFEREEPVTITDSLSVEDETPSEPINNEQPKKRGRKKKNH